MTTNWDRWHWLLDKKAAGPLDAEEAEEFARFQVVVDKLDAADAELGRKSMDRLVTRHRRVLESTRRVAAAFMRAKR